MVALGLGLFALSMVIAVALGWKAAEGSKVWDEASHINLVQTLGNGKGKK
ncbi:MAG TPA: hypothetical protein VGK74_04790 [Symbiobacteriaceae bacterium]|jgi:hypothetical protein